MSAAPRKRPPRHALAGVRLMMALAVGIAAAVVSLVFGAWAEAAPFGWVAAATVFLVLTWRAIGGMNADRTARYATREDATVGVTDAVLIVASLASLGGVAVLLAAPGDQVLTAVLGVASVVGSWLVVHTSFTLQYAALYYAGTPGGIDFNQKDRPNYTDFAYLGFTMGMTYQVSDTSIGDSRIRRTALHHALLSFLLGAIVLATTINLVVNLAK